MSNYNEILSQIRKADLKLQMILDEVSKMRVECVKMQLDILSLYKPECLEILELLKVLEQDQNGLNESSSIAKFHPITDNKL